MTGKLIAPSPSLGYSQFYLDYLAGRKPAVDFVVGDDLQTLASRLDKQTYNRAAVCDILLNQNTQFGVDQAALDSIRQLTSEKTLCVFAGQQAGLFGGPLLVVVKALAIVKLAREFSQKLSRPVIPIFWIAGDDHDFDEIASTIVLSQQSELVELKYGIRPSLELPASEIRLDNSEELARLLELLKASLGQTDFTAELYAELESSYKSGETFVGAFGKFMARLTRGTGLAFFNPCDAQAKTLAVPLFERIVDEQPSIHQALRTANESLQKDGYHLQVEKKESSALLFRHRDGRKPVHVESGKFTIGGETVTPAELKVAIRATPEQFSPDVMTRPLMQSTLFPVLCQIGGPAEVAYLAQCRPLFDILELPKPIHRGRPSLTLLEKRIEKLVDEYNLSFEEITGDIEQAVNRVMLANFPKDLEAGYRLLTEDMSARWKQFADTSLAFDPSLAEFANQTYGKIDFTLKNFESKLFSAHKKKGKEIRERIHRVQHHLFPRRTLQERTLNISCYLARYGLGAIPFLLDRLSTDQTGHQLISLSEK